MRERDHSQVPVFAKKDFRGLLTGNTIVRWLGSLTDAQCADVAATTVGEVLNSSEPPDNFIFIGKNAAIVEAEDMLLKGIQDRREIDALLITENGSMNEPLLGIMTTWDIATSGELTRPGY
jgi:predicted transcriptional regulator